MTVQTVRSLVNCHRFHGLLKGAAVAVTGNSPQTGLTAEKKRELALEVAKVLNETLGSPMEYIHVGISEIPSGQFVESGQIDFKYSDIASDTKPA